MTPRVVIGVAAFRGAEHLDSALTSLLAQQGDDVAFVLVDDASGDDTLAVARRYAAEDDRLHIYENSHRLGMVDNWNRVLDLARELAPDAPYFAWGSDHDHWDSNWLAPLVHALDADRDAVLAYPHVRRFDDHGTRGGSGWSFDTAGDDHPARRLRRVASGMVAGDMVYGLFRRDALVAVGGFPRCIYPDRLLLARLSLLGPFHQLAVTTWHRRMVAPSTPRRQRGTLFATQRTPVSARLPWWLIHARALAQDAGPFGASYYGLAGAMTALSSIPHRLAARVRRGR